MSSNPWSTLGQVAMAKGGDQFDTVDARTFGQSGRMHNPVLSQEKPANGAETPIISGDVRQLD